MNRALLSLACGSVVFAATVASLRVLNPPRSAAPPPPASEGGPVERVLSPEEEEYRARLREFLDECRSAAILFGRSPTAESVLAKCAAISERHSRIPSTVPEGVSDDPTTLTTRIGVLERWTVVAEFGATNFLDRKSRTYAPEVGWRELRKIGESITKGVAEIERRIRN